MREGALFGTMFGLGVAAVAIGVTVSRLVVGPTLDRDAAAPASVDAAAPAAVQAVDANEVPRTPVVAPRKKRAPAVALPDAPRPDRDDRRPRPAEAAQPAVPSLTAPDGGPIAIVRGGAAPAARAANGARVIQVGP